MSTAFKVNLSTAVDIGFFLCYKKYPKSFNYAFNFNFNLCWYTNQNQTYRENSSKSWLKVSLTTNAWVWEFCSSSINKYKHTQLQCKRIYIHFNFKKKLIWIFYSVYSNIVLQQHFKDAFFHLQQQQNKLIWLQWMAAFYYVRMIFWIIYLFHSVVVNTLFFLLCMNK